MVTGHWNPAASLLFTDEENQRIKDKLTAKINTGGFLLVKSQVHRSQLSNKEEVIRKMNELVKQALTNSALSNLVQQLEKYPQSPATVFGCGALNGGLCGYFYVGRHRRNVVIWEKVPALFFLFVCFYPDSN